MAAALVTSLPARSNAADLNYKPAVPDRPAPPYTSFDKTSTAAEVTAGMDLSGMTALVTGCNSGLGLETMRVLAMRGAHVIGAARTAEKAENACASVEGVTTPLVVELTDLPGIVSAAEQVAGMDVAIDALILNAGIMALPELRLSNGVEMQFAVNHVGHFLLANRLLDQVVAAKQGRVVVVSSGAHRWAPEEGIQFDNLDGASGYDPWQAYGQSPTNLSRHLPDREIDPNDPRFKTIPQGAATQCYVATSADLERVTGYYFSDCNPAEPNHHMQDDDMAAKLWLVSEELVANFL
jgi:hypothetical protein